MRPLPFVLSNTAVSIDGKIATANRARAALGSAEDRRRMRALRDSVDAVLVGGATFRTWGLPLLAADADPPHDRRRPLVNAVLTRRGVAHAPGLRFPDPRVELVVLAGPGIDAARHRAALGASVEQTDAPSPRWALERLRARGCARVMVEGGGDLIAQLLAEGLLDELHVTLCPLVVGGASAPTLADGPGFLADALPRLRLLACEPAGDEVFLRYAVAG